MTSGKSSKSWDEQPTRSGAAGCGGHGWTACIRSSPILSDSGELDRLLEKARPSVPGLGIRTGLSLPTYVTRRYGDDLVRPWASILTNTGMNVALGMTPVGKANTVIQAGGKLLSGVELVAAEVLGSDDEMRNRLREDSRDLYDSVERADLSNVTRRFSETIWDVYTKQRPPLETAALIIGGPLTDRGRAAGVAGYWQGSPRRGRWIG